MNKTNYLSISGLSLIAAGVILIFSENIGVSTSKILVPICFIIGSICTYLFAQTNKQINVAKQFHLAQSLGLLTFGILIATIPDSLSSFLTFTTYFIIVYGLFEVMFSFMVLNSKTQLNKRMLMVRLITGAINLIGGFILLLTLFEDAKKALMIAGIIIILGGVGFLISASKVKQ